MKKTPLSLFAFIFSFIKNQKTSFILISVLSLGWALDSTLFPYILKMVIDALSAYDEKRALIWGALTVPVLWGLTLWISVEICHRIQGFIVAKTYPKLESAIRMTMFDYAERHSYHYFAHNFAGSISNKLSDMTRGTTSILELIVRLFLPVGCALLIAITLFSLVQPLFGLILFLWLALTFILSIPLARKCNKVSEEYAESRSTLNGKIVDSFMNSTNVKLFARFNFERKYLQKYQDREQKFHYKSLIASEKMKLIFGILCFLGAGIAINGYMFFAWEKGLLSTGDVVFIFNTTWNITMMVWFAALEIPSLFKEWGTCTSALSLITKPHDVVDKPGAKPLVVSEGSILFDNASFSYTENQTLFSDKHLEIKAGTKVGLVGFSGSGKTTLVHLILRYFDLQKGRILIDDQDIATVTSDSLRESISFIPQDTSLFHRTILENIRYGRPDASLEEVEAAAKKAHCHEFIEKMPDKYASLVGERGITLSGGQRQRIAIARAILKDAPIIILDEATAALDSLTEGQIQESLKDLMHKRTTLVIAHRLSTLADMDRILVFKEGHIIEDGTHAELLKRKSHYAHLWKMQAGGFLLDEEDFASEMDV
ncbi:MAG: ABC transporter ATP-binding protein [Chlamydiota bacterium]